VRVRKVARFVLAVTAVLGVGLVACSTPATATSVGVDAWGYNGDGQLGNGTVSRSDPPTAVKGLRNVAAIAAGGYHSLALLRSGTVMSWGQNIYGDLGNGTSVDTNVPTAVCAVGASPPCSVASGNALSGVTAISAGGFHALALLANGTVVAWGDNVDGEVGDGSATATGVEVPVPVRGLGSVTAISAGGNHSLALLRNGTVKAWGADGHDDHEEDPGDAEDGELVAEEDARVVATLRERGRMPLAPVGEDARAAR